MTKAEFLEKLRIELSSGVTPQVLQENLNYYGQYIDCLLYTSDAADE